MGKNKSQTLIQCAHFLNGMKTCSLFANGFYLPPKEKRLAYCQTSKYKKCPAYKRYYQMEKGNKVSEVEIPGGRRRFKRIHEKRKVLIRACDPMGNETGDFTELSLTADYCQGGMRIILKKEIPEDSLLLFKFDHDFLIPSFQGFAQLCWQRNLKKSPKRIEAGLVFKDFDSIESLNHAIEHVQHFSLLFSEKQN